MQSNVEMTDDIFRKNYRLDNTIVMKYGAHYPT